MKRIITQWSTLLLMLLICQAPSFGQTLNKVSVTEARFLGKTAPLRDMPAFEGPAPFARKDKKKAQEVREVDNFAGNIPMPTPFADQALPKNGDPLAQLSQVENNFIVEPSLIFEGADQSESGVLPPDPIGDVSPEYYMHAVNQSGGSLIRVYDKEGNQIGSPVASSSLWVDLDNFVAPIGDPIILWDPLDQRWLFAEMTSVGGGGFAFLVAISETSDPTGSYYAYEFQSPMLPDYPKVGIWQDAIFVSTNEFFDDIPVYALDKSDMYSGQPVADVQRLEAVPKFNSSQPSTFQVVTPVDIDGSTPPPPGSPHYVVRIYDDAWEGGEDALEVWAIDVDFDDPNNTTITGPTVLPTAPFDSELCNGDIFNCIAQPGGTLVSALQQVVMYRVPYRNFGTHETILLNFSVDVDGNNTAGVRWYELRKEGGGDWTIYQEGTFAPDENSYFQGSLAMDGSGNILMGYSVTGPDQLLSQRFTGRLASDPLNTMTITEFVIDEGESLNFNARWGDYADMVVDPSDDRTFWYTGEIMRSGNQWGTVIMSAVVQRDSVDIGVGFLESPENSAFLTDAEPVTIGIRNYGLTDQVNFDVSLYLDGAMIATETITDTLHVDSTLLHTFAPTVDLSAIQPYEFLTFTSLATDSSAFNDTLRTVVAKLPRYDATVIDVTGTNGNYCGVEYLGSVILQNAGVDTLTSATISFSFNGSTPEEINWTGVLATGQSEPIAIDFNGLSAGTNEVVVTTSMPNGQMDENPANDTFTREFEVLTDGNAYTLTLLTDLYPNETSWELLTEGGDLVAQGGNYTQPQFTYTEEFCLVEGCYLFRIFDSFGDGISFGGVTGNYEITDEEGNVVVSLINPNFGTLEENPFCTTGACTLEYNLTVQDATGPAEADGSIFIDVQSGNSPFEYSINGGSTYSNFPFFPNLIPGDYEVVVKDAANCLVDTIATVSFNTSVADVNTPVSVRVLPNPTPDNFRMFIEGLKGTSTLPVEILDANGRTVNHSRLVAYDGVLTGELSLAPFPSGFYYVRIVHPELATMVKVVKQ
jgi:hypothetical protein